jgi:hypothetical protein
MNCTLMAGAHRRFGVDNPILGKERVDEGLKVPRIGERGGLAPEDKLVVAIGSAQSSYKPLAEDPSEDLHRQKEGVLGADAALLIRRQSAAGTTQWTWGWCSNL